ncbi:uncharacterized protein DC041_0002194 [Schistosoma bovis]|uniref:LITAF domain-containing protein n=1 Tax=Schistosoma bovis TaxID=6184 RepID=A0A430QAM2_SCHBO|nr:uncharacterized protein DC041_0002194 [Schistosoma bovis]
MVVTDQPTSKVTFSDIPVTLRCPSCGLNTLTTLEYKNGLLTYLASGGICLIGFIHKLNPIVKQLFQPDSELYNSILPPDYPMVVTDQPTSKVTFSDIPVTLRCPSCGLNTLTTLEYKNGLLTYLASGGICLIG